MNLTNLPKTTERKAKRVGRGIGSGKGGHTSGRGTKGQKARTQVKLGFEGTKTKKSFVKRLPLLRGKGRFKPWGEKAFVIKLGDLTEWPEKTPVTLESLKKAGLVPEEALTVKVLADGELKKALTLKAQVSKNTAEKVVKAGGKIEPVL
jgi:large subunit ribosomal protein L15